ncbi:NUDIX domain-containing protein, partial [Caldisalinibacter kiritimatiensis]|uniref:NUDIX domain-containing protein n=1 Tax=Caldisalinibacter kiritimatiensis TaxID=1304284 RepID=UPI00138B1250
MKLIYNIKGTNGDIEINFTQDAVNSLSDSDSSLVFPFYKGNFVMSYHLKRQGWEIPAGIREKEETPEECAIREAYEETGAILDKLKPLGYYIVKNKN